jgi:hypothetical protein
LRNSGNPKSRLAKQIMRYENPKSKMSSKTLPINMAQSVAFASLAPARKVIAIGERARGLTMYVTARAACENRAVRIICGDNLFDPYAISCFAKRMRVRPEDALRSIRIARAFTAYQLAELVSRLDTAAPQDLVVISGPCSTFFDDDVPFVDAARLFYRVLWRVVELARGGMTLLLVQEQMPTSERRAYFLTDLSRASDVALHFGAVHTFRLEHHGRAEPPRLAAPRHAAMGSSDS